MNEMEILNQFNTFMISNSNFTLGFSFFGVAFEWLLTRLIL